MVRATPAVEPARPGARALERPGRDRTAGGRLARAAGPGAAGLTRNESQSMYFHKGNHGLSGTGPGYIYVILSNAQPEASARGRAATGRLSHGALAAPAAGPGPGPGGVARGGGSLLAGGEASVIDPAGPYSDLDRESDSQESDPENRDQTDEEDDPGEQLKCAIIFKIMCNITKNVQNCC